MRITSIVIFLLMLGGCENAYYAMQEKFGNLKNDILVDRVEDAMDAQEEAKEEFKDAYEQFESVVSVPASELKSVYKRLNDAYEEAQDKAAAVSRRIDSVEEVAEDLFAEWDAELEMISNASLRSSSALQLRASRRDFAGLIKAMKRAESRMEPVLRSFRDHVLFLKHNLNAQAISSLRGELGGIEADVGRLIQEMERSISEAQSFLNTWHKS